MIDEDLNNSKNIGKGLLMCAFLASASMGMQQVQASETDLSMPTLDALHNAGTTIPGTTDIYPESAYTLTQRFDATAPNTIVEYELDKATNTLTPLYYQLGLKKTEYGTGANSTATTLTTPPVKDVEITSKYDTSQTRLINTTDQSTTTFSGDYINQNIATSTNSLGGAIYNVGTSAKLGNINGNFIKNYSSSTSSAAFGGAIYNETGVLENISGNFIGNYTSGKSALGGAIYNFLNAKTGNINANFIENYSSASISDKALGGAIYNYSSTINNIIGNFIGNYTTSTNGSSGGAIYNENGTITNVTGDFIGNSVSGTYALGGAIDNFFGQIGDITGDFIGNYTSASATDRALGRFIYNYSGTIGNITGNFINNHAFSTNSSLGGAIYNENGTIGNIKGNFTGNYVSGTYARAGAMDNSRTIGNITGDFIGNYASATSGSAKGGAIYNFRCTIADTTKEDVGIVNSSFINNYVKSTAGEAKGGAIWTNKDLNFVANNRQSVFSGNYTESAGVKDDNAIYVDSNSAKLSFKLKNSGSFVMKDNIDGTTGYDVDIQGDDINNTNFYLQNDIKNADVTIGNTTLNLVNNQIYTNNFNSFTLTSDTNMKVDVDLANSSMDRITATTYGTHSGNLIVNGMNLLSDMKEGKNEESILFADTGLKDNVVNGVTGLPDGTQTTLYTPIYKYTATYDNKADGGYFDFTRGDKIDNGGGGNPNPNPYSQYNPAIMASPVAAQFGGYMTQLNTYEEAFSNMDLTMLMTQKERNAMKYANKYAMQGTGNKLGTFSPNQIPEQNKGAWFRPYASFEKVNLKNGPKVGNVMYGSLIGGDSPILELKHGWDMVYTGYAGYNGSHQNYDGVSIYQNGGTLGASSVFYKGNFFTGLTADVGASVAEASTMYGHDDITMLMTGIASKTGYNWELAKGRFVIQPNYLMSYTFVNTFDYTNSAGVRINSDPLNAVQIVPGIKFIGNLKNAWQPYASVQMVWNIMDDTKVKANNINLPELSVKPYIQYGIGLQKRWGVRFTGFFQTMFRNDGRTGVAFQMGFRWSLGKAPQKVSENSEKTILNVSLPTKESVTTAPNSQRKIIKQLTDSQRVSLGAKAQNTTMTSNKGYFSQL